MGFLLIEHALAIVGWAALGFISLYSTWTVLVYQFEVSDPISDQFLPPKYAHLMTALMCILGPFMVIMLLYIMAHHPQGRQYFLKRGLYTPAKFEQIKLDVARAKVHNRKIAQQAS